MINFLVFFGFMIGANLGFAMEVDSLFVAYLLSIVPGIVLGFIAAFFKSISSRTFNKESWVLNRNEALNSSIVLALSAAVLFVAMHFLKNFTLVMIIFLCSILLFSNFKRIWRRSIPWKKILIIGTTLSISCIVITNFDLPYIINFVLPCLAIMLGEWIYSTFFYQNDSRVTEQFCSNIKVFGKIAALDGGVTEAEFDFLASRYFCNSNDNSEEENDVNQAICQIFAEANQSPDGIEEEIREFARLIYLNEYEESMVDYFSEICVFAMIRNNGELSEEKIKALYLLGEAFDIHRIFVERIIEQLKGVFNNEWSTSGPNSTTNIDDCYEILGCKVGNSFDVVKKAYYMMCKLNHPDRVQSLGLGEDAVNAATEKMQQINDAYQKIKDYNNWK